MNILKAFSKLSAIFNCSQFINNSKDISKTYDVFKYQLYDCFFESICYENSREKNSQKMEQTS